LPKHLEGEDRGIELLFLDFLANIFKILFLLSGSSTQETRHIVFFLGGSHASRIQIAFSKIPNIHKFYKIESHIQKGATIEQFQVKIDHLGPNDLLIVQLLGNDLLERQIERYQGRICLKKFIPISEEKLETKYLILSKLLSGIRASIYLIDNPYRHLRGNKEKVPFPGLKNYWHKKNQQLKLRFPEVTVIKHTSLLEESKRKLKISRFYASLMPDDVHFEQRIYAIMVQKLLCKIHIDKGW
jgi:hypothetical protein